MNTLRVSILERLVPSLAFMLAAISGAVGALMIVRFFAAFGQSEVAGYAAFFGGVSEIEIVVGCVLVFAAVLCAIGILVSIIRLFTTNKTASSPGWLFLITGLLSVVPPFAIHYMLHTMKHVVVMPEEVEGGISAVGATVGTVAWLAILSAGAMLLVLLAFSFIPFSSRAGRKASPLICLVLVEIVIAVLAGIYFWEARTSIVERDKDRTPPVEAEFLEPHNYNSDPGIMARPPDNRYNSPDDTNSNSSLKAISGGVLNGKAIELPQPDYPPAARAVRAAGSVSVQVLVDERGEVISATAVSGHPMLRAAAVQAARKARFKPTILRGDPVKVTGVLTYNFSAQ